MASAHIPELDRNGLRRFGLTTGAIVALLFGLAFPWLLDRPIPIWPWAVAGALAILALAAPAWLRPVYVTWMRFGLLASKVTTPIIMGAVYFLIITPVSLCMRLAKRDPLSKTLVDTAPSYRVLSKQRSSEDLERPF